MLTDLRFAFRQLAKAPGFTVVALLTLSIGIGSATVVFSAINALLFKPLPHVTVPEDRLLYATERDRALPDRLGWNYLDYQSLRERSTTLAGVWVHSDRTVIIAGGEKPERLLGTEISWDAFALMGVPPMPRPAPKTWCSSAPPSGSAAMAARPRSWAPRSRSTTSRRP